MLINDQMLISKYINFKLVNKYSLLIQKIDVLTFAFIFFKIGVLTLINLSALKLKYKLKSKIWMV